MPPDDTQPGVPRSGGKLAGARFGLTLILGCTAGRLIFVNGEYEMQSQVAQLEVTSELDETGSFSDPKLVVGDGPMPHFPFPLGIYYPHDAHTMHVVVHGVMDNQRIVGGETTFSLPGEV